MDYLIKLLFDSLVSAITNARRDPREEITRLLDAHPKVAKIDADIDAAIKAKFG